MKYCWEYTSDYLEYRKSIGLDDRNPKYFITIFSQYLKDKHPQETHLTKEMTMPWCVRKDSEKIYSYRGRMSVLRQFTFFLFGLGNKWELQATAVRYGFYLGLFLYQHLFRGLF